MAKITLIQATGRRAMQQQLKWERLLQAHPVHLRRSQIAVMLTLPNLILQFPAVIRAKQGDRGPQGEIGPQGPKGDTGATGNGIASIQRTSGTGGTPTR